MEPPYLCLMRIRQVAVSDQRLEFDVGTLELKRIRKSESTLE